MRFSDRLKMSVTSLLRRKLRTVLTVLGVVIGIAAIVTMLALGEGQTKKAMQQIEEFGSIKEITVYENYNSSGGNNGNKLTGKLTEETIKEIMQLEHVVNVKKVLTTSVTIKDGPYETFASCIAMPLQDIKDKNWEFGQGGLPEEGARLSFMYGNGLVTDFSKPGQMSSYYSTGELPNVDLMKDVLFITFDSGSSAVSLPVNTSSEEDGTASDAGSLQTRQAKKYIIPTSGVFAGTPDEYHEYFFGVYCDMDALLNFYKKNFRNKPYPGQPVRTDGKPFKQLVYSRLAVEVDELDHVQEVQKQITDMGYQANSESEWIAQEQASLRSQQAMLGGVGAIALLVAAIGIANTMMMSIYERTKEIGIMKVLGCHLKVIRSLFMIEAALIGFTGGVVGIIVSYIASFIINKLTEPQTAVIEPYLVPAAMAFAVLISMLAGFMPSKRAMQLSPLAAIRNE